MADTFRRKQADLSEMQHAAVLDVKLHAEALERALDRFSRHPKADPDDGGRRCLATARTKLEECVMWASKGITA